MPGTSKKGKKGFHKTNVENKRDAVAAAQKERHKNNRERESLQDDSSCTALGDYGYHKRYAH